MHRCLLSWAQFRLEQWHAFYGSLSLSCQDGG